MIPLRKDLGFHKNRLAKSENSFTCGLFIFITILYCSIFQLLSKLYVRVACNIIWRTSLHDFQVYPTICMITEREVFRKNPHYGLRLGNMNKNLTISMNHLQLKINPSINTIKLISETQNILTIKVAAK